jgi:hypothetical protein
MSVDRRIRDNKGVKVDSALFTEKRYDVQIVEKFCRLKYETRYELRDGMSEARRVKIG